MISDERWEAFREALQRFLDNAVEYEENERSEDFRLFLPDEWVYRNLDAALLERCNNLGIDIAGIDMDKVADSLIEFCGSTTLNQFAPIPRQWFVLGTFRAGEIEVPLSPKWALEDFSEDFEELISIAENDFEFCIPNGCAYLSSDMCYVFYVTDADIKETVETLRKQL